MWAQLRQFTKHHQNLLLELPLWKSIKGPNNSYSESKRKLIAQSKMDANDKHCVYVTQKERKSWNMYNDFNVRNSRKQEHFQNQNIKCNAYFNVLKERREQLWEKLKGIYPAQSYPGMAQSLRVHFLELTRQWWGGKKPFIWLLCFCHVPNGPIWIVSSYLAGMNPSGS